MKLLVSERPSPALFLPMSLTALSVRPVLLIKSSILSAQIPSFWKLNNGPP